ncbi:hypothetical protein C8J57DRAFT_1504821 [Mycena rebaudengoi]|nr:hypothetical protein C8J57DRAFT_1504821 [Mycena rebaudengoi]
MNSLQLSTPHSKSFPPPLCETLAKEVSEQLQRETPSAGAFLGTACGFQALKHALWRSLPILDKMVENKATLEFNEAEKCHLTMLLEATDAVLSPDRLSDLGSKDLGFLQTVFNELEDCKKALNNAKSYNWGPNASKQMLMSIRQRVGGATSTLRLMLLLPAFGRPSEFFSADPILMQQTYRTIENAWERPEFQSATTINPTPGADASFAKLLVDAIANTYDQLVRGTPIEAIKAYAGGVCDVLELANITESFLDLRSAIERVFRSGNPLVIGAKILGQCLEDLTQLQSLEAELAVRSVLAQELWTLLEKYPLQNQLAQNMKP